jgi:hypothetical protein
MITFDVSPDLRPEGDPLRSITLSDALEARGVRGAIVTEQDGPEARLVDVLPLNGFVMTMHTAYALHRPLVIGPDDVWGCIVQGLARHVSESAEELRARLVRHTGKIALEVRRDELAIDPASTAEWAGAVSDLASKVREHLGGRVDLFVARFSTTGHASRVASQIALLDAVQSYFEYTVGSLCGIPRVTLLGTADDWADMRQRVRVLGELDLAWWAEALDPVLAEMENTARGKPSVDFWQRAYKLQLASGGEAISGWVNALFPYTGDRGKSPNRWFTLGEDADELDLPKLRDFPCGLVSAPFTWRLLTGDRPMRLVAGFMGVSESANGALSPAIGWAVTPAMPERMFRAHDFGEGVVRLSPRDVAATSLEGLRDAIAMDSLRGVKLSLVWCKELESLSGIEGIAEIRDVDLLSCDRIERLDPLAELPALKNLWIQQCPRIVDLRSLARLRDLVRLAVNHNPAIVDYSPISEIVGLENLDLFGETVPAAVRGRHAGREAVAAAQALLRSK